MTTQILQTLIIRWICYHILGRQIYGIILVSWLHLAAILVSLESQKMCSMLHAPAMLWICSCMWGIQICLFPGASCCISRCNYKIFYPSLDKYSKFEFLKFNVHVPHAHIDSFVMTVSCTQVSTFRFFNVVISLMKTCTLLGAHYSWSNIFHDICRLVSMWDRIVMGITAVLRCRQVYYLGAIYTMSHCRSTLQLQENFHWYA